MVVALGMAIVYDSNEMIGIFLKRNYIFVNLFLVIFWALPLENGILIIIRGIQEEDSKNVKNDTAKNVSGFFVKP